MDLIEYHWPDDLQIKVSSVSWEFYEIVDFSLKTFEDFFDLFFKNDF